MSQSRTDAQLLSEMEGQFTIRCHQLDYGNDPCSHGASWVIWSAHDAMCRESIHYSCHECKDFVLEAALEHLETGGYCGTCGWALFPEEDSLSDYVRFIRL